MPAQNRFNLLRSGYQASKRLISVEKPLTLKIRGKTANTKEDRHWTSVSHGSLLFAVNHMIQKAKSQPEYLTVEEFAALTPVSAQTIRRYIKNGQLPYLQPAGRGGNIMIRRDALDQMSGAAGSSSDSPAASGKTPQKSSTRTANWRKKR